MNLIDNREIAYEAEFLGELPYYPLPDEMDIGLSGLWRVYSGKGGPNNQLFQGHLNSIPDRVYDMLLAHDIFARDPDNIDDAAFGLIDRDATLPNVATITSKIIITWEKALRRKGHKSVMAPHYGGGRTEKEERLANLLTKQSLVVEAAASVISTLPIFAKNPSKPTVREQNGLANVLANWGPQFLIEWMDGTIIDKRLGELQVSPDEREEWLKTLMPSIRKHIVVNNVADPLAALDQIKANLDMLNDDALLAKHLGCTEAEVAQTFTQHIRKYIAFHNIANPLVALNRVKANLEMLDDRASLAERPGWTKDKVAQILTPTVSIFLAVNHALDPLAALDQIKANLDMLNDNIFLANYLGLSVEKVEEALTQYARRHFAVYNCRNPLAAARDYVAGKIAVSGKYIASPLIEQAAS